MAIRLFARTTRFFTLASFMAMAAGLLSVPVYAIDQSGLGGKPAYPRTDNVRSQSIFVHTLTPGEQAKDGVQVINNTGETKTVSVYAVDSQTSSDGAFACAQAADKPLTVGTWIKMDKSELTLAAGEKRVVNFTITTPDDVSPGEHNGCVVIQDTERQPAAGSNGIVLSLRSAIRLVVTVPGEIQKGLAITGLDVQIKDDQKLRLGAALKNNGNVSLDTLVDLTLWYPLGMAAAEVGGSFPVLSNSESQFNFEADRPFWGGWYRLTATAAYNDDPAVPIGEGKANTHATRHTWVFIAPTPIAAAIEGALFIVLFGGAGWLIIRHLRHKKAMATAVAYVVAQGDDLHSIADTHGMSWKYLARINKLKAPYSVKTGQRLSVTPNRKTNVRDRK